MEHSTAFSRTCYDVDGILIPEFPYSVKQVAKPIRYRSERGTNFSIVAIAESALSRSYAA
jgi:ATP-dependent phosphofructokinase / diphosphate-dependent phosphofructokinase